MRTLLSLALVGAMAGVVVAQEPQPVPDGSGKAPPQATAPEKAPPTPEGDTIQALQELTGKILDAARSGDAEKLGLLVKGLALRHHEEWFTKVFGPEIGARLAGEYGERLPKLDEELTRFFQDRAKETGLELSIVRLDRAGSKDATVEQNDALAAMKEPVALYTLRWMKAAVSPPPPESIDEPKAVTPKGDPPKGVPPAGEEGPIATHTPVVQLYSFAFIDHDFRFLGEMRGATKPAGARQPVSRRGARDLERMPDGRRDPHGDRGLPARARRRDATVFAPGAGPSRLDGARHPGHAGRVPGTLCGVRRSRPRRAGPATAGPRGGVPAHPAAPPPPSPDHSPPPEGERDAGGARAQAQANH